MSQLAKLLNVRPGEGFRVALLTLQYFCIVAVTIAGKSARDTYFLSRYNKSYLPLMFVVCAVVVALMAWLYSRAAPRMSRVRLTDLSYSCFIVILLAMHSSLAGPVIPALYVWVEVVISLATLQFWMQAAELFDARQAKRLFALIGAGGSLAAFIAGMSLKPYVHAFGSGSLLLLVSGALAASWVLGRTAPRYELRQARSSKGPAGAAPEERLDPYLILIALIVAMSAVVTQIVDYQFKIAAGTAIPGERELAAYFGRFYAATGVASLVMQLFVTSSILKRFGLRGGLLTLPVMLASSAVGFLVNPGLLMATVAKFGDQAFKFTLNNSSLELLWLPVSAARRRALKPVVGGAFKATAEASAGLATFFLVKQFDFRYLSVITLAAVAVWLVVSVRVALLYVRALARAIERREVDMTGLEIDVQDPSFQETMGQELEHPDLLRRLFALELIEGMPLRPWAKQLRRLLMNDVPETQNRILELAQTDPDIVSDDLILEMIDHPGALSAQVVQAAASRALTACLPGLGQRLRDPDDLTRATAAAAILKIGGPDVKAAKAVLTELAEGVAGPARAIAIESLWDDYTHLPAEKLRSILATGSPAGRTAAAAVAARRADSEAIPAIIANLSDPRVAPGAREALSLFPPSQVAAGLQRVLQETPPSPHRSGALRAYQSLVLDDAAAQLARCLPGLKPPEARLAAHSLLSVARRRTVPPDSAELIQSGAGRLARNAFLCVRALSLLPPAPATVLLRDYYENQVRETVAAMILLGSSIKAPDSPVEQCIRAYESADTSRLPFVLEFIDSSFRGEPGARLVALLEQQSWLEKDAAGRRFFPDLPGDLEALALNTGANDDWASHVWSHYFATLGREASHVIELGLPMFSTLEKTILLKSVSLFQNIAAEKLSRVAAVAQERKVPQGTLILREGDFGDSMFVVVDGAVRVHRGEQELTVFHRGDCLGEMALLDSDPRSASATALEETTLLEIDQENFYQVMEANPEIMHQIVKLLTRRLREANDRIAARK